MNGDQEEEAARRFGPFAGREPSVVMSGEDSRGPGVEMQISFMDHHYRLFISESNFLHVNYATQIEHMIVSNVYKALRDFHQDEVAVHSIMANLKHNLYDLCAQDPSLAHEFQKRGLI